MPAEVGGLRPESPAALDDKSSKRDKKYRQYASNVERALALFDTALQEWADYISFLGRLLKALQTKPPGAIDVPHTALVAKRLAQCLDPRLPSGVHQKALEVYAFCFAALGKDGLARDLTLYLPGLSPTLSFASLSVKPALLSLFENYIVALESTILQPALKAITLALLPGLEEESSEEFERTYKLLNRFKDAIGPNRDDDEASHETASEKYFWQSIFLATMTSSSRRQGALQYLVRSLPRLGISPNACKGLDSSGNSKMASSKLQFPAEIEAVTSPEPGLLIRCFAAGLRDDQVLVQRGFLDLLVTHLPLSSPVLQYRVSAEDLELLISAAASVVARREMSLNRRLWSWFIGPETSKDPEDSMPTSPDPSGNPTSKVVKHLDNGYFESYGLAPLTESVRKMIADPSLAPAKRARPFRICLSLMDRSEIGGLIVPRIFVATMESIWEYEKIAPSKDAFSEVLRSAHVFFDGIQSRLIWSEIILLIDSALNIDGSEAPFLHAEVAQKKLDLVWFIITKFNVREEEMLVVHMPMACLLVLLCTRSILESTKAPPTEMVNEVVNTALRISIRLLDLIPERAFETGDIHENKAATGQRTEWSIQQEIGDILSMYQGSSRESSLAVSTKDTASSLVHNAAILLVDALESSDQTRNLEMTLSLLAKAVRKSSNDDSLNDDVIFSNLLNSTGSIASGSDHSAAFSTATGLLSAFEFMSDVVPSKTWTSDHRIRQIAINLMMIFWASLSPSRPQHNVEAVRNYWRLQNVSPIIQLTESTIATLMTRQSDSQSGDTVTLEGARHFATLWAHSSSKLQSSSDRRSISARAKKKGGRRSLIDFNDPEMLARPLLLLLDSLSDRSTALSVFTISWLQSLPNIQIIFDFLIHRLHTTQYMKDVRSRKQRPDARSISGTNRIVCQVTDCSYYLRSISDLIQYCSVTARTSLNSSIGSLESDKEDNAGNTSTDGPEARISHEETTNTAQVYLLEVCTRILEDCTFSQEDEKHSNELTALRKAALQLLRQLLQGPSAAILNITDIENSLINILSSSIEASDLLLQGALMETLLIVLQSPRAPQAQPFHIQRRSISQVSLAATERSDKDQTAPEPQVPPPAFLDCLLQGLSSSKSRPILDQWVRYLNESLPIYDGRAFQALLPLVECFSKSIEEVFDAFRSIFEDADAVSLGPIEPINTLNILLNGLEQTLARGHDQLVREEAAAPVAKSPEQAQGFFGNMVSGVFASEGQKQRPATANDRLTVLICFKDSVSIAFRLWSWGDAASGKSLRSITSSASFNYSSIRLRNRARRLLEHLFAAEPLECLETLVEAWRHANAERSSTIFNLLHALEASRPKNTIPATFNAIYSRTNPIALDPRRSSTLTSELSDTDLAGFLVAYTRSIDDDALDEIWTDCMAFAKDVLGNPMPQRQILPRLLEFVAILGKKIDNTNFGEQRRMRREIGDLFVRLLAAMFTIKPLSFSQDSTTPVTREKAEDLIIPNGRPGQQTSDDVVTVMAFILPDITPLLVDTDRIIAAATTISTQILGPTFRWKTFPQNVTSSTTDILRVLSKLPEVTKIWRKDVAEAYNDPRFFCASALGLVQNGWMPILRQWSLVDKDRMPELLTRLIAPTSAGIMFGVGATSARMDADRKTQLNLRRIAFLLLSNESDDFIANLSSIQEKVTELMNATAASSPSSITRAEIYMVLRALILKVSPVHLSSFWPVLNTELYSALSFLGSRDPPSPLNVTCLLQAAKLLDILLTIAPDDFQLREWLYITDTIDAVYRPSNWKPVALVDDLAERLDATAGVRKHSLDAPGIEVQHDGLRRPLLRWENMQGMERNEELVDRILRPFLRQLSITAFESTYQMETADRDTCVVDLLKDIFDDSTLV